MQWRRRIGGVGAVAVMVAVVAGACAAPASPSASPTTSPSPSVMPSPTPSPTIGPLLTRDQAVAAARAATSRRAADGVLAAELRRFSDAVFDHAPIAGATPSPDAMVWVVNLGTILGPLNGQGTVILVDAIDGHVIQAVDWIS